MWNILVSKTVHTNMQYYLCKTFLNLIFPVESQIVIIPLYFLKLSFDY